MAAAETAAPPRSRRAPEREVAEHLGDDDRKRPADLIAEAAQNGGKMSEDDAADALELFFKAEGEDARADAEPQWLKVNVGTAAEPKRVRWLIQPVDDTEITRIRDGARTKGTRAQRRNGTADVDEGLVARRIVVLGTVTPDFKELAKRLNLVDPADAVSAYFKKFGKTGLITQLSGEILGLSGWDDEAIQEMEVEAAQG
jgi:hypothetical protein